MPIMRREVSQAHLHHGQPLERIQWLTRKCTNAERWPRHGEKGKTQAANSPVAGPHTCTRKSKITTISKEREKGTTPLLPVLLTHSKISCGISKMLCAGPRPPRLLTSDRPVIDPHVPWVLGETGNLPQHPNRPRQA